MDMIIGRFLTALNSSKTIGSVRAGVTTTRAGNCRISVGTAPRSISPRLRSVNAFGASLRVDDVFEFIDSRQKLGRRRAPLLE
jgi:hypothetical protein